MSKWGKGEREQKQKKTTHTHEEEKLERETGGGGDRREGGTRIMDKYEDTLYKRVTLSIGGGRPY